MSKTCWLLFLFFALSGPVSAQQKYGHFNSMDIVQEMPEFKQMNGVIERRKKEQETQITAMYADYQQRMKDLNEYGSGMMEAILEEKMKEADSLKQKIQSFQDGAESGLTKLRDKLTKPIVDKLDKIVAQVAKENGYTYIFDISSGGLAYFPEKEGNITELVRKKLGFTQ